MNMRQTDFTPQPNSKATQGQTPFRINMRFRIVLCMLYLGTLLVGCTSFGLFTGRQSHNEPKDVSFINIAMYDSYYGSSDTNLVEPPVWKVPGNQNIIIEIENLGDLKHNWAIVQSGITVPTPFKEGEGSNIFYYRAGMVYSNNKTTVAVPVPPPGEYLVICTVEGHYPYMQGRLVVE